MVLAWFSFCLVDALFFDFFFGCLVVWGFLDFKNCLIQIYVLGKSLKHRLCQRVGLLVVQYMNSQDVSSCKLFLPGKIK